MSQTMDPTLTAAGWNDGLTRFHEEHAGAAHPIDIASRVYAVDQLRKAISKASPEILEIGCSSGYLLHHFKKHWPEARIMGADIVSEPLQKIAKELPDVPLHHFDVSQCPLPESSVDGIVMLNVLEHIRDDAQAVREVFRILRPGGVAFFEVPAGPDLYDVYDETLFHFRRYSRRGFEKILSEAGFTIERSSHLGFWVYPGFWFVKRRNKKFHSAGAEAKQQIVSSNIEKTGKSVLVKALLKWELLVGRLFSYPVGTRCVMTCRKPEAL